MKSWKWGLDELVAENVALPNINPEVSIEATHQDIIELTRDLILPRHISDEVDVLALNIVDS